jgi:uncharacterized protein YdeI (YjbR/CyaY-like superfamily)
LTESVDEALCFGWIDGIRRRIDANTYSIRFTPRKPTSICAKKEETRERRLATLIAECAANRWIGPLRRR